MIHARRTVRTEAVLPGRGDAMEAMGVLRPGIDRYSIERIARDYLGVFQSTLADADNQWENQMSAEEKRAARRARRARIGQDLFATQAAGRSGRLHYVVACVARVDGSV